MNNEPNYFSHHPLEDPANFRGTEFDPAGAELYRRRLHDWKQRYRARCRGAQQQEHSLIADTPSGGCRGSSC
ncbi:hypothetical protein [Variovorax sp. Root411]|uniref:hypothetical protein n=1 Tax=Variovorax sp. Root411 TaxID=1736530 RepID=UPI0012FA7298|nr:hypothetical protein [Variovorax sp. Root411]